MYHWRVSFAVIGAGGFIGSKVAQALLERGEEVLVVSRSIPRAPSRIEVWERANSRSLLNLESEAVDFQGCTKILNFAADMGGVGYFSHAQVAPYITNSRITFNVLEAAARQGVEQLFMASSACAYPVQLQESKGDAPMLSEDLLELGPADQMYGREKLMICSLSRHMDFDCRVGILHTIYGDVEVTSNERMKFPTAIATKMLAARATGSLRIWGDGTQLRSYLYIDDAVAKILRMMEGANPGPLNIGYQGAISVSDVVSVCQEYLGIQVNVETDLDAPSGVLSRDCSNARFWSLYGFMEPIDYRAGFGLLIEGLIRNQDGVK